MMYRKDLLEEDYATFKAQAEEIIHRYHYGTYYRTDLKESRVDLKEIVMLTHNSPTEFLRVCSLYKFLTDLYQLPYIKKIIDYAKQHGFSFEYPSELKQQIGMDAFSVSVLRKKEQDPGFTIQSFCDMVFVKQGDTKKFGVRVPLLEYSQGKFSVQESSVILESLHKME
ncbi:MAG: hypothetical protein QXX20_01720 [Candidatus Thermoplasmatota archaeon]